MRRRLICLAIFGMLVLPHLGAGRDPHANTIYIQPLGKYSHDDAVLIQQALSDFYKMPVRILPRVELPAEAYAPGHKRYRAEKLLDYLDRMPSDGYRLVGLTDADISTTKDKIQYYGIIGLAVEPGRECVISSYRCRLNAKDAAQARVRLAKVAVHEVGHTFGLDHCATIGCLMEDAKGSIKTCDREVDLCQHCRTLLGSSGYALGSTPTNFAWLAR
jgi:archaemetzincin